MGGAFPIIARWSSGVDFREGTLKDRDRTEVMEVIILEKALELTRENQSTIAESALV